MTIPQNKKKQRRHDATAMKENTKIHKEKKPHWHDANANEEHRNTEPHPAASYVPGKCHRTLDPADKGQETYGAATRKWGGAYQPKNPNQHPRLRLLARLNGPAPAQEDTATGARACDNR